MKSLHVALVSTFTTAIAALPAFAQEASAQSFGLIGGILDGLGLGGLTGGTQPSSVPEIDASTAMVTFAAIAAVLAFAWERKRRRA